MGEGIRIYVGRCDTLYVIASRWRPPYRVVVGEPLAHDIPAALDVVNRRLEMALQKPAGVTDPTRGIIRFEECELALLAPTLYEWLTAEQWADGSPRTPGTYCVFTGDGLFKMVIKDRDAQQTLWVAAPSLTKLYAVAEAALTSPSADWRMERVQGGDQARRARKKG